MSFFSTVNKINFQTLAYAPAVYAGVQVAESAATDASGTSKQQAVVNGVLATSGVLASAPNANVAGVSQLVNLTVSILNALGVFSHKAATA